MVLCQLEATILWAYVAFSELGFNKDPRASKPGTSEGFVGEIRDNDVGIGEVIWYCSGNCPCAFKPLRAPRTSNTFKHHYK